MARRGYDRRMITTRTKYRANSKRRKLTVTRSSKPSRIKRLLFWLLAAVWFSAGALISVIVEFPQSTRLFTLVFTIAAMLLWIMVFQSLREKRNAFIQLNISPAQIAPGETFSIDYEICGAIDRFRHHKLAVRGREYIHVDIGDNIHSETHDVFESILLAEKGPQPSRTGKLQAHVPESAMHSFNERSHRFEWHLVWKAKQKSLPNIDDEILLSVSPAVPGRGNVQAQLEIVDLSDSHESTLLAGSQVRQQIEWFFESVPDYIEHRIVWIYGCQDREFETTVRTTRINAFDARGRTSIDLQLPAGPYSYAGKLLCIRWAIDIVAYPSREKKRQHFSLVAPTLNLQQSDVSVDLPSTPG